MNGVALTKRAADWRRLKALVLDSVSSPITRRVYNLGLDELIAWFGLEPRSGFNKATVSAWRVVLEARGLGSISINVRITAVRKLAVEAADNGLLAPELAAGICRIKGVKMKRVRLGNWLSVQQAQALLNAPDATTNKGLRDRPILAVLLGCGLRRSEVAAPTMRHIQLRDARWCIVDLVGKHGRVRTVSVPTWVKKAVDAWTVAAGVTDGHVFRAVERGDRVRHRGPERKGRLATAPGLCGSGRLRTSIGGRLVAERLEEIRLKQENDPEMAGLPQLQVRRRPHETPDHSWIPCHFVCGRSTFAARRNNHPDHDDPQGRRLGYR